MSFVKAERKRTKIKLAITGPSGSGKTYSSLKIAKGLGDRIAVIDTENGSASLYAGMEGMPEFDVMEITAPFTSEKYQKAIKTACEKNYDVLIIDSISHQWNGEGGIMDRMDKDKLAKPTANIYTMWAKYTPEHERFKATINQAPIHIIATMRSKQDYVLDQNEKGKTTPRKIGMAPIQRDGTEYEYSIVFDCNTEHFASVSKDRTSLFDGDVFKIDESVGDKIKTWLESGKEVPEAPKPEVTEEDKNFLVRIAKENNYTLSQVLQVMKTKYGVDRADKLTKQQFENLCLEVQVKGDVQI